MTPNNYALAADLFNGVTEAVFDSREAFDVYLAEVRERRERRRTARAQREHWLHAVGELEAELTLAREDADAEIIGELSGVLEEFARRLEQKSPAASVVFRSHAVISSVAYKMPLLSSELPSSELLSSKPLLSEPLPPEEPLSFEQSEDESILPPPVALANDIKQLLGQAGRENPSDAISGKAELEAVGAELPQTPLPPPPPQLSALERQAQTETLRLELDAIAAQWTQIDAEGLLDKQGALRRPQAFALRALACQVGSAYARARECGLAAEVRTTVRRLRNQMEMAREFAHDRADCLPFAEECWSEEAHCLNGHEWQHLAARYADMERAQTAYYWYCEHQETLGQPFRLDLLNAIGAMQQSLFRALEYFGGGDRLQGDLYGCLLESARSIGGYLTTLRPEMTDEELETTGSTLEGLMQRAEQEAADNKARQEKESRRNDALAAALAFFTQNITAGGSSATLTTDRKHLLPLLKECLATGVPPTNVQVRNALLLNGPRLLENQSGCERILEAVLAERKRRGMDALAQEPEDAGEEEPSDTAVAEFLQMVRPFTEGQKLLILGGVPRQRVCEELEQTLGCAEVKWPQSKKSDRASKFQTDIKRADMLLLVKNFASHDMSEKGREWIKGAGGHFVFIPSGYGVNQLINQLYKYVMSDKVRA